MDETASYSPEVLRGEELAREFLACRLRGESPDRRAFLDKLADETARAAFEAAVELAEMAAGSLPGFPHQGQLLGKRYELIEKLGSGGMGCVYLAKDTKLGRRVAVKVLFDRGGDSLDRRALFEREWRILADLDHPNVVRILDSDSEGEFGFIVMEHVDGKTLDDLIGAASVTASVAGSRPRFDLAAGTGRPDGSGALAGETIGDESWQHTAARVVLAIARAVGAAHEHDIVHRDLKPANVMVRKDGQPVVLDFGLAGRIGGATGDLTRRLVGSPNYVAPEQIDAGCVGASTATDIYQLGLILYEMLTLRKAFPGDLDTALGKVKTGEFVAPRLVRDAIAPELEAICLEAMRHHPADRYPRAADLAADLERWLAGRVPEAMRGRGLKTAARTVRSWSRRHRGLLAPGVVAIVAAGIVIWSLRDSGSVVEVLVKRDGVVRTAPEVSAGEVIGFRLTSRSPRVCYVLSAFGDARDPPTFVAPLPATGGRFGRRVEPGEFVACGPVEPLHDQQLYEGLLILTAEEPRPEIEAWFAALEVAVDGEPLLRGVPFERARLLLAEATGESGAIPKPLGDATDAEIREFEAGGSRAGEATSKFLLPGVDEVLFQFRIDGANR